MAVINTNYLALVSQNNLTKSQSALGSAIERLSSGLRINSAKDDAAGQAIANRFTANIRGLTQAARNSNDGISIAQTTEGALTEINNNLQRIRELSVQAANGSNSESDLNSIQNEIKERMDEIDRVSRETQFNSVRVLAGTSNGLDIQVGANDGEIIHINLREISVGTLNLTGFNVNGAGVTPNVAAKVADLDAAVTAGDATKIDDTHYQLTAANSEVVAADALKSASGTVTVGGAGVDANALGKALSWGNTSEVALTSITGDGSGNFTYDVTKVAETDMATKITADTGEFTTATYTLGAGQSTTIKIDDGGAITDLNGNAMFITTDGELTLNNGGGTASAATAANLATSLATKSAVLTVQGGPTYEGNGTADQIAVNGVTTDADALVAVAQANAALTFSLSASVDNSFATVEIGNDGGLIYARVAGDPLYSNANGYTLATETLTDLVVHDNGNITGADAVQYFVDADGNLTTDSETIGPRTANPLKALDDALADVDALRSELGAVQNRFESTIANLSNTVNNLSAARSRIEDADYAVEVSNMTRAQILQQAGTAVLAQANQIPQTMLSLLR